MDSVARFLALLTVTTAAGAATSTQAAPVSNELKILCQRGVVEACKTIAVHSQLKPIWAFEGGNALGIFGERTHHEHVGSGRPPIY